MDACVRLARTILPIVSLFALTAPAARKATPQDTLPIRFAVYGDTRDGHKEHREIVAQILQANPAFVLQTGDLVHASKDNSLWKIYDDITGEMRRKIPVYTARGNHDFGGTAYEDRMTAPFTSGNKLWYSFNKGNSHFIALAIDEFSPYDVGSLQYQWLEADLIAARPNTRHIFVFFHSGPYSIGSHGSNLTVRRILCPLFDKFNVDAVFNGHDHIYYHTKRNGVHYLVTGGGGAPLYYPDPKKGAIEGDKWERAHHYLVCEVNGERVEITANHTDGTPIEHFTIIH